MAQGIYLFLFLSMSCCAVGFFHEDAGLLSWTLLSSCQFRRRFDWRVCCSDLHCPADACCQAVFDRGALTAVGRCEARDPGTLLCSRQKHCNRQSDCGRGSCCRFARGEKRGGVCDRLGQEGDACTTGTNHYHGFYLRCPCDNGLICQPVAGSSTATTSRKTTTSTTTTTTSTTTEPTTTTATEPTTTTASTTTTTPPGPCDVCPDPNFFCCLNGSCLTRPIISERCGLTTCPCQHPYTCSNPSSPTNEGICQ